jgi:hypothetical protein
VLTELGLLVHQRRWERPLHGVAGHDADAVARIARRLCLPSDRHEELAQLLTRTPPPTTRDVLTLWWDPR